MFRFVRTITVAEKLLDEINLFLKIFEILIQIFCMGICTYNMIRNAERMELFLIYFAVLCVSFIYFMFYCISYKYPFKGKKQVTKYVFKYTKYFFRVLILGISLYDVLTTDVSKYTRMITYAGCICFLLQILFDIIGERAARYVKLFKAAVNEDTKQLQEILKAIDTAQNHKLSFVEETASNLIGKIIGETPEVVTPEKPDKYTVEVNEMAKEKIKEADDKKKEEVLDRRTKAREDLKEKTGKLKEKFFGKKENPEDTKDSPKEKKEFK